MKSCSLVLALALGFGAAVPAEAQQVPVSGSVTDSENGSPISGAAVQLESGSATVGPVTTNQAGQFQLNAPAGRYTLVVRVIGYQPHSEVVTVEATGMAPLEVQLLAARLLLDDIIISASGVPEKQTEMPAGGHTIPRDEILEQPAPNIGMRLSTLGGIDVAMTGMQQSNIVARGFNNIFSGALLVLVDNRVARVPSIRLNAYNMIPSTDMDVDRIEVVLGPGAALYGPNSASGVLHILTPSPIESPGTSISLMGGGRSLFQGTARTAHRLSDNTGFKLSGSWTQAKDWEFDDPAELAARANDPSLAARDNDQERWSVDGRFDWRPWDDGTLVFAAGRNLLGNSIELTGQGAGQAVDWAYTYAQARLRKGRLFAQLFTNSSDAGDSFLLRTGDNITDMSRTVAAQIQHGTGLFDDRLDLIYGFDLERITPKTDGTITGRNEDDDDILQLGGYLHGRFALAEDVDLVGALRVDHHDRIAEDAAVNYSPRAAIVWNRREGESFRFTYNRAFSPPTTNNLFLDLRAGTLPIAPGVSYDIRTRGVPDDGFRFTASCPGGVDNYCMRSPLAPGQLPATAVPFWNGVVTAVPQIPAQLKPLLLNPGSQPGDPALASALLWLNQIAIQQGDLANAFQPDLGELTDIEPVTSTITNVFEAGYRGTFNDKLVLAANLYRTGVENFVGPLRIETPTVHFDLAATAAYVQHRLGPALQAGLVTPEEMQTLVGALALAPIGTVAPDGEDATDLLLTYRNFGDVDFWGGDLEMRYLATPELTIGGSLSLVSEDCFDFNGDGDCFSGEDIALNAAKTKGSVSAEWDDERVGLSIGSVLRFNGGFPMNSGVYVGAVESYETIDVNVEYRLPWAPGAAITLSAYNLDLGMFDHGHREFVGAPEIGQLFLTRLTYTF